MFKTTSKDFETQHIVKINNTEDLTKYIWNFIDESSKSGNNENTGIKNLLSSSSSTLQSETKSGPEKVAPLESLGTIKQRLSHFISSSENQAQPRPKSLIREGLETEEDVKETISKIVSEQESIYHEAAGVNENLQEQIKIIQEHLIEDNENIDLATDDDKIIEVYVDGELVSQAAPQDVTDETAASIGPQNKVTWTLSAPQTPNSGLSHMVSPEYYDTDAQYQEYDAEDAGSRPELALAQPPHIVASNALTSLNNLFREQLSSGSGDSPSLSPLDLIKRLQQSPTHLPESETLNIILTPGGGKKSTPNIAILPTSELPDFSSSISHDIGVDIEAILSALAGSASKMKNMPMIVEENHTQLIKRPGKPTKMKIKETMSEILGDSSTPKINVLSNKEEENSFIDLESLIRQVTGEHVTEMPYDMPKSSINLDDNLKLNVSTKTNIVNIFAFNIYPSGAPKPVENYQLNDFSSLGTSIKTQANVVFQPPGEVPTLIESQYDYQSAPSPPPSPPSKRQSTLDKILGAVLLSQLEGGGSDRVIAALGQNPEMMAALMSPSSAPRPVTAPPVSRPGGLYPAGVDNLSEYSPGPYGTIARNSAIKKLILAMSQAEQDTNPERFASIMNEMPEYAKLLLKGSTNNRQSSSSGNGPIGPLGYPLGRNVDDESSSAPVNTKLATDLLQGVDPKSAAAALMGGAVVTFPYWLPLLAGGRRRRRRFAPRYSRDAGNPDISSDWLALLTGSKYGDTETITKRLDTWVTQKTTGEEEDSADTKDDIPIRRKSNEKVRVSLTEKDKGNIQEWRKNYITNEKVKVKPELYSNYYPSEKTATDKPSTATTTTTILSFSTTITTITTSTKMTSIKSTTTKKTSSTFSYDTTATIPDTLLFWTTARPKLSFRKPFRSSTMITTTTSTTPNSIPNSKTYSSGEIKNTVVSDNYWYFSTTRNPTTTTKSTTKSETDPANRSQTTQRIATPSSGFLWFTKKPIYQLDSPVSSPSSVSPSTAPSEPESQDAWWKKNPGTMIKLSAVIRDSTSSTTKSVEVKNNDEVRPNFNNEYSYNQPITRTPSQKVNWNEKFKPVRATPLYQTQIIVNDSTEGSETKKKNDFMWMDDVAPKSSMVSQNKKVETKSVGTKFSQKEVNLPKWPYVENLWNKVDKIMGDLLEPEDIKTNNISNINNIFSSLRLNTSDLEETENDNIYNSLNKKPSTKRPDQAYWQNLKKKYGFISAYTEHYPETDKTTEAPDNSILTRRPVFYNSGIPSLNEILLETEIQGLAQPQVIQGSNSLYFDSTVQPPSQPYHNHPNILVAKRNISSSSDVLEYLNELMKESGSSVEERETTMRSFFKPDLLPASQFPEEFTLLKEIDKVQESLGNNKNLLVQTYSSNLHNVTFA